MGRVLGKVKKNNISMADDNKDEFNEGNREYNKDNIGGFSWLKNKIDIEVNTGIIGNNASRLDT